MADSELMLDLDTGDAVQNLANRVSELEQTMTDPDIMTGPQTDEFPGGIVIGGVPVTDDPPTPPSAIVASPSTHFDDIVADVSWTPAVGTTAVEYQVELAWWNGSAYVASQLLRTGGNQVRIVGLRPDSTYGVRVYAVSAIGIVSTPYPAVGFQDFTTAHDATTPALLGGLVVTPGVRSIVAVWNEATEVDVSHGTGQYELTIATNAGFTTGVRSKFFGGNIGGFTDLSPQTQYWVKVRSIDATGNPGPYTAGASTTTAAVITDDMAPNTIDAAIIYDATILEAKIGNGQITNAKIVSLVVDKVTAGNIASKDFVLLAGGQIKSASLSPGIVLNSQGLSLYDSSAVRTVFLDALTGNGTFTGTISGSIISGSTITGGVFRTAAPPLERIELASSPSNVIQFFSGDAAETGAGYLSVSSAISGGSVAGTIGLGTPWMNGQDPATIYMRSERGDGTVPSLIVLGATEVQASNQLTSSGNFYVAGTSYFYASVVFNGAVTTNTNLTVGGTLTASGALTVSGVTNFNNLAAMNDQVLRLRGSGDPNHAVFYAGGAVEGAVVQGYSGVMLQTVSGVTCLLNTDGLNLGTGWFRTNGDTGWYNQTYGGGMRMTGSTWVEVYAGKWLLCGGVVRGTPIESTTYFCAPGPSASHDLMSSGNVFSTHWTGSALNFNVDDIHVKTFVIPHPKAKEKYLVHAAMEGPTADVVYRGRGKLVDGQCWVELPNYFEALTKLEGRTVMVTPILSRDSFPTTKEVERVEPIMGPKEHKRINVADRPIGTPALACTDVVDGWFIVGAIAGSPNDCEFFWEVKATRKNTVFDVEPLVDEVHVKGDGPYRYISK